MTPTGTGGKRYTISEYAALPEDGDVVRELVDGRLVRVGELLSG